MARVQIKKTRLISAMELLSNKKKLFRFWLIPLLLLGYAFITSGYTLIVFGLMPLLLQIFLDYFLTLSLLRRLLFESGLALGKVIPQGFLPSVR